MMTQPSIYRTIYNQCGGHRTGANEESTDIEMEWNRIDPRFGWRR
jgi:hypothetical protein